MARAIRTHEMPVKVEEGEGGAVPNFRPRLRYKLNTVSGGTNLYFSPSLEE